MNQKNKQWLLDLAQRSIKTALINDKLVIGKIPSAFTAKQACFVTLTKKGDLRGCIGHLLPVQPLYVDVIDNARAAALNDYRFDPVTLAELPLIKIEISILDIPKKFAYCKPKDLTDYLAKNKPGVIIKKGFNQATFLPQVWDELKTPEEFLAYLCQKAGLPADEWQRLPAVEVYRVAKLV